MYFELVEFCLLVGNRLEYFVELLDEFFLSVVVDHGIYCIKMIVVGLTEVCPR